MVIVITRNGFKLPFMGKEKFIELMKAGLRYDGQTKTFHIENLEYLEKLKSLLSEQLKDEITFAQICFLCNSIHQCNICEYQNICRSRDVPTYCICGKCLHKPNLYGLYLKKTNEILPSISKNEQH